MLRPPQALLVAAQMDTVPYRHLLGSLDTILEQKWLTVHQDSFLPSVVIQMQLESG